MTEEPINRNPFTADTLETLLTIADDVETGVRRFVEDSTAAVRGREDLLSLRDRILIGLELKIESAFRALVVDARARRIEAVHHLKTMVEAFIYLHVVGQDLTDRTAERLIARVVKAKSRFLELNSDYDDTHGTRKAMLEAATARLTARSITPLEDVGPAAEAHSPELRRWYKAVYRAACEPAHVADLFEFVPSGPVFDIAVGELRTGLRHAIVAMEQALHVMLDTIRFTNDNQLNLNMDISAYERRLTAVRNRIRGITKEHGGH